MRTASAKREVCTDLGRVLLVTSDDRIAACLHDALGRAGHEVCQAAPGLDVASAKGCDVLVLDLQDHADLARETLAGLDTNDNGPAVVLLCAAEGELPDAELEGMALLGRPVDARRASSTVAFALRAHRLERENRRLARMLGEFRNGEALIGCSPASRRLQGVLRRVAQSEATVLIEGARGSGKSLVARILHASGRRCDHPLVVVASAELEVEELERLLHEGEGRTLLFEDVSALPAAAQARLVRHLKERPPRDADVNPLAGVRILATSAARLPEMVARGEFREDLFYRLNACPVAVPSLKERREDIPLLARHFLERSAEQTGVAEKGFTPAAAILLETLPWPENVTQLENAVRRAHALARGGPIDRVHLLGPSTGLSLDLGSVDPLPQSGPLPAEPEMELAEEDILPLEEEEKRLLGRALHATKGNVRRAAELLHIGRATLYRKIQIYQLKLQ